MKKFLMKLQYVWKMMTMPAGTVFELDWGKPTQSKVGRVEYIRSTLAILR